MRILALLLSLQLLEGWLYGQPTALPVQVLIRSEKLEFRFGDPIVICHFQDPPKMEFDGEHRLFVQGLGVEYVWVEPDAQNYYQHTFLSTRRIK